MDYNAIVREKNAEIIGKVLISDLKNLPSTWMVTYNDNEVQKDTDLKTLLCDNKFPMSVYTSNDTVERIVTVKSITTHAPFEIHTRSNHSIDELKLRIYKKIGVPVHQQRLVHANRQLECYGTVGDYVFERRCTMHLILRLQGGGCSFSSVDLESEHVKGKGVQSESKWEGYSVGLNSKGICPNRLCVSRMSTSGKTYSRNGYVICVLKSETSSPFLCTACSEAFILTNFIVSSARSLFRFRKTGCAENQSTILESFGGINNYSTFDPKGKNAEYEVIEIRTVKEDECVYSCLQCDNRIRLRQDGVLYDCGHPVHTKCLKEGGCKICNAKLMTSMEFKDLIKKCQAKEQALY